MLSAIILTNKESKVIKETTDSVSFADEILILNMRDKVVNDFSHERNLGLSKAKGDWILFVDDDEVITKSLAKEIQTAIASQKYSAYYLKRLDRYFGQTLHHGETGNIKIIRLARRDAGQFVRPVHETWQVTGKVGQLKNPLLHNRGKLVSPFIDRMILYSPIDAKALTMEGKSFSYLRLLINPLAKFIYNYKIKLGFLDGYLGLFQAYLMSVQSLSIRVFQWGQKS